MRLDGASSWADLWAWCTEELGSIDEARHIVEQASGRSGTAWLITTTAQAPQAAVERVERMVSRRKAGEPLQYVVGRWGFRHLMLHVDKRVLIPRPETEIVTQAAISFLDGRPSGRILDLGTGSGAIALSLAYELSGVEVWASDASMAALEVAKLNYSELPEDSSPVHFLQSDWFASIPEELKGTFDVIISNPPYVAEVGDEVAEPQVAEWEPHSALFAGPDGLDDIRQIIPQAIEWLCPGGALVLEIAPSQAQAVVELADVAGYGASGVGPDLADRDRWLLAAKPVD